jgi:hypothetical protein
MKEAPPTSLTNEQRLIFALLKSDSDDGLLPFGDSVPIDWKKLLDMAHHYRVEPLVYAALQAMDRVEVPPMAMKALAQRSRAIAFKMLGLSGEMGRLSSELESAGIRTLMLKGPVLAADLYGDLSLRSSSDLDILVPFSDLGRTDAFLAERGYEKLLPPPEVLGDWKWRCHHDIYVHKQKGLSVEVHWRLHPGPVKEPGFERLWASRRVLSFGGHNVNYLGREELFVYLAYHGARHGWFRLRWLTDIDRLVKQPIDWQSVKDLCRNTG